MLKTRVLVDEMNVIYQLHRLNVEGFFHWNYFYKTIENLIGGPSEAHYFCANVNNSRATRNVHQKRKDFFNGLRRNGIQVHEGFTVLDSNKRRLEKGVDVLIAMEIYKSSLARASDIIVCSGDSDLIPAIKEAQNNGSRVHIVVSDHFPAREICEMADSIIPLETILSILAKQEKLKWKDKTKPFIYSIHQNYNEVRKGLVV